MIKRSEPIREKVYNKLKSLILNGEITEGERVIEVEWAEKLGVSRTPLREAIRMLELEGLLVLNSTGGVEVKRVNREEIEEIFEIRIALEGMILKELIRRGDKGDIEILENILKDTKYSLEKGEDNRIIFEKFALFNTTLDELSKYKKVVKMIKDINLYLGIFRKYSVDDTERKLEAFNEHWKIVEALKSGDLDLALKLNEEHIYNAKRFFISKSFT
jgi:DNA-binding GntR family transcriptional regulator